MTVPTFPESDWAAARSGDIPTRNRLVTAHVELVHNVARRRMCTRTAAELDEVTAAGLEALIDLVTEYDPARGISFAGFAVPRLRWRMLRHQHRQASVVSTGLDDAWLARSKLARGLAGGNDSGDTGGDRAAARLQHRAARLTGDVSLDEQVAGLDDVTRLEQLPDDGPGADELLEVEQERAQVRAAVASLEATDQALVWARTQGMGREQVAQELGTTVHVLVTRERKALDQVERALRQ